MMGSIYLFTLVLTSTLMSASLVEGVPNIAFVLYNSEPANEFAFVALDNIENATEIFFTDKAKDVDGNPIAGSDLNEEGVIVWTADSLVKAGTVVCISNNNPGTFEAKTFTCNTPDSTGPVGTARDVAGEGVLRLGLGDTGDGLFAELRPTGGSTVLLAGLNNEGSGVFTTGALSDVDTQTNLPSSLTVGVNAVALDEKRFANYNGFFARGTADELRKAIYDKDNWVTDENTKQFYDKPFTVLAEEEEDGDGKEIFEEPLFIVGVSIGALFLLSILFFARRSRSSGAGDGRYLRHDESATAIAIRQEAEANGGRLPGSQGHSSVLGAMMSAMYPRNNNGQSSTNDNSKSSRTWFQATFGSFFSSNELPTHKDKSSGKGQNGNSHDRYSDLPAPMRHRSDQEYDEDGDLMPPPNRIAQEESAFLDEHDDVLPPPNRMMKEDSAFMEEPDDEQYLSSDSEEEEEPEIEKKAVMAPPPKRKAKVSAPAGENDYDKPQFISMPSMAAPPKKQEAPAMNAPPPKRAAKVSAPAGGENDYDKPQFISMPSMAAPPKKQEAPAMNAPPPKRAAKVTAPAAGENDYDKPNFTSMPSMAAPPKKKKTKQPSMAAPPKKKKPEKKASMAAPPRRGADDNETFAHDESAMPPPRRIHNDRRGTNATQDTAFESDDEDLYDN